MPPQPTLSCSSRRGTASCRSGARSATYRSEPRLPRAPPRPRAQDQHADELAQRPTRPAFARVGVRRVAAGGCDRELRGAGGTREHDRDRDGLDVAADEGGDGAPRRNRPEPVAPAEREEDDRRPDEPRRENGEPRQWVRVLDLRQPEPRVQRRQDEQERERVRRDDEQRDDRQCEQRDRLTRDDLLLRRRAARHEPVARGDPADGADDEEARQREHGPVARDRRRRVRRPRRAAAERVQHPKTRENETDERPEEKPAAQRPQRGAEPQPVTAGEREEIDCGDDERQQQGDQHELERPAADRAIADPDRTRRSRRCLEALVERAEQLLRGTSHLHELRRREAKDRVADRWRGAVAGGRGGGCRQGGGGGRAPLVEGGGEAGNDQLAEETPKGG